MFFTKYNIEIVIYAENWVECEILVVGIGGGATTRVAIVVGQLREEEERKRKKKENGKIEK